MEIFAAIWLVGYLGTVARFAMGRGEDEERFSAIEKAEGYAVFFCLAFFIWPIVQLYWPAGLESDLSDGWDVSD